MIYQKTWDLGTKSVSNWPSLSIRQLESDHVIRMRKEKTLGASLLPLSGKSLVH